MHSRVVVTGMGVVAPNGIGVADFYQSLWEMRNGIRYIPLLQELGFSCQIGGEPPLTKALLDTYFSPLEQRGLLASGLIYGVIAGLQAWEGAGFQLDSHTYDEATSIVFGTGILGVDKLREAFQYIDNMQVRKLGSTSVLQTMASGISAYLGGKIGAGNQVTTNSSACSTGVEALLMGYQRIQSGQAKRVLVGSCSDSGPYVWGGFDALRVLPHQYNERPSQGSRPMDMEASGFVPAAGAGALLLEDLDVALQRNARIYGEVLGGCINSGGQRNGGSMTAPNAKAVQSCIQKALINAQITPKEIDTINGHLTATKMDAAEIENWTLAMGLPKENFPVINSLKGMIGHALAAAGSIELVASMLQIHHGFIFGNRNLEKVSPSILEILPEHCFPTASFSKSIRHLVKASFGFGDVNAVAVLKKYEQ